MPLQLREAFTARVLGYKWDEYKQSLGAAPYLGRSFFGTDKKMGLDLKFIKGAKGLPIALKGAGVAAVIAESFARIFYRNATNVGVPLLEAPGIAQVVEDGEEIEVDMEKGIIISESGEEYEFKKLPPFMLEILESGGLINYLKEQNE